MNQDTEDTLLETEIYMILLYNLICESGDSVGEECDRVREKARMRVHLKWGLPVRLFRNIVGSLGRGQGRMDGQLQKRLHFYMQTSSPLYL